MRKEKVENKDAICPLKPNWTVSMLTVLPSDSRGKLEKYLSCPDVQDGLRRKAQELGKTISELGFPELEEKKKVLQAVEVE